MEKSCCANCSSSESQCICLLSHDVVLPSPSPPHPPLHVCERGWLHVLLDHLLLDKLAEHGSLGHGLNQFVVLTPNVAIHKLFYLQSETSLSRLEKKLLKTSVRFLLLVQNMGNFPSANDSVLMYGKKAWWGKRQFSAEAKKKAMRLTRMELISDFHPSLTCMQFVFPRG